MIAAHDGPRAGSFSPGGRVLRLNDAATGGVLD